MGMKKAAMGEIALTALAIALMGTATVFGSLAILKDESTVIINTVKIGNLTISLDEEEAWEDEREMRPGETLEKSPVIKNEGTVSSFIRVTVAGAQNYVINYNYNHWLQDPVVPNVWYYKEEVEPQDPSVPSKGATNPLFTSITLKPDYGGDGTDLDITLHAEAIQSKYLVDADGNPITDVFKAFELFDSGTVAAPGA